jgi:hypothetical protein
MGYNAPTAGIALMAAMIASPRQVVPGGTLRTASITSCLNTVSVISVISGLSSLGNLRFVQIARSIYLRFLQINVQRLRERASFALVLKI